MSFLKGLFRKNDDHNPLIKSINQRRDIRAKVGDNHPLKIILNKDGQTFQGKILDVSNGGFGIVFNEKQNIKNGDILSGSIIIDNEQFNIEAETVRVLENTDRYIYGFQLTQTNYESLMKYFKSILPILIGQTLKEEKNEIKREANGNVKRAFWGASNSNLNVWFDEYNQIDSFEFQMNEFIIRGDNKNSKLNIFIVDPRELKNKNAIQILKDNTSNRRTQEIEDLFTWIVSNLGDDIPAEIKNYLLKYNQ